MTPNFTPTPNLSLWGRSGSRIPVQGQSPCLLPSNFLLPQAREQVGRDSCSHHPQGSIVYCLLGLKSRIPCMEPSAADWCSENLPVTPQRGSPLSAQPLFYSLILSHGHLPQVLSHPIGLHFCLYRCDSLKSQPRKRPRRIGSS